MLALQPVVVDAISQRSRDISRRVSTAIRSGVIDLELPIEPAFWESSSDWSPGAAGT